MIEVASILFDKNLKKDIKIFHTALCNDLLGKSELLMMAEIIASQRASPLIITNHRSSFVSTQHGALKYRCVSSVVPPTSCLQKVSVYKKPSHSIYSLF